jgi:hypothetical protein
MLADQRASEPDFESLASPWSSGLFSSLMKSSSHVAKETGHNHRASCSFHEIYQLARAVKKSFEDLRRSWKSSCYTQLLRQHGSPALAPPRRTPEPPHFPARHPHFSTAPQTSHTNTPPCLTPTSNRSDRRVCSNCNSREGDEAVQPAAKAQSRTSGGRQPQFTILRALLIPAQTTRMYVPIAFLAFLNCLVATACRATGRRDCEHYHKHTADATQPTSANTSSPRS